MPLIALDDARRVHDRYDGDPDAPVLVLSSTDIELDAAHLGNIERSKECSDAVPRFLDR